MLRPRAAAPEGSLWEEWTAAVAPEGLELREDQISFPEGELLPLTVREGRLPGDPGRPLARLQAGELLGGFPASYSVALRREPPDIARQALRARRTLLEGVLPALAEETGRRPSMAEQAADVALDRAEWAVQMGAPAFRAARVFLAHRPPHARLVSARCYPDGARIACQVVAETRTVGWFP
ncbi:MAG: hypothetical protein RMM07_11945 [Anaerolineae bacterium]|nr:hypothetical protein [Anaerolineae bacterium]